MQRPEAGYLLIADITGYTRFLTGSELDHARGILEQLFSALLDKLRSPFLLSNIQGDAILAHARAPQVADGGHVLDIVENLYCGFAESLERMLVNTTCTCAACRNISNLDLKLVVHYGEYIEQDIAGRKELSGPEVILVHRLLKNKGRSPFRRCPSGCHVVVRTGLPFASNRLVQMLLRFQMRRIPASVREARVRNLARLRKIAVRDAAAGPAASAPAVVAQTTLKSAIDARLSAGRGRRPSPGLDQPHGLLALEEVK